MREWIPLKVSFPDNCPRCDVCNRKARDEEYAKIGNYTYELAITWGIVPNSNGDGSTLYCDDCLKANYLEKSAWQFAARSPQ